METRPMQHGDRITVVYREEEGAGSISGTLASNHDAGLLLTDVDTNGYRQDCDWFIPWASVIYVTRRRDGDVVRRSCDA